MKQTDAITTAEWVRTKMDYLKNAKRRRQVVEMSQCIRADLQKMRKKITYAEDALWELETYANKMAEAATIDEEAKETFNMKMEKAEKAVKAVFE